jgi:phosphatidylinositol glycan class K
LAGGATKPSLGSDAGNIHAIIVSSSRYWFNYRHAINALGIYEIYRQNGIPDENIILSTLFGRMRVSGDRFDFSNLWK